MGAVGATSGVDTETAADFSSGGFSNRWSMPEYQKSSVLGFLESQKDRIQEYVGAEYLPTCLSGRVRCGLGFLGSDRRHRVQCRRDERFDSRLRRCGFLGERAESTRRKETPGLLEPNDLPVRG